MEQPQTLAELTASLDESVEDLRAGRVVDAGGVDEEALTLIDRAERRNRELEGAIAPRG